MFCLQTKFTALKFFLTWTFSETHPVISHHVRDKTCQTNFVPPIQISNSELQRFSQNALFNSKRKGITINSYLSCVKYDVLTELQTFLLNRKLQKVLDIKVKERCRDWKNHSVWFFLTSF